jgi:hypothetical protein
MSTRSLLILGAVLIRGPEAQADEIAPETPAPSPVTAEDVEGAPRPEDAAGYEVEPREPRRRPAPASAVLEVPRVIVKGALQPVRLALWTEDEYHVSARARELMWNDDRTAGVLPVASWRGGLGLSAGAALVDRDFFGGSGELRAMVGTSERYNLRAMVDTADLLGRWRLELSGGYRDVTDASCYVYGDADEEETRPAMLVDPTAGESAYDAIFREQETKLRVGVLHDFPGGLTLTTAGSLRWIDFGPADPLFDTDDMEMTEVYDVSRLPGYDTGVEAARAEVALLYDRRRTRHRLQSRAAPSTGFASQIYGGWQEGLDDDRTRFGYGGVDAIHYIDLYGGDRVLSLRGTVDAAFAPIEDIPFIELPTLGGSYLLRGYESSRFRDRWAASASAEYTWPVTEGVASFTFVDAGRVARVADDLFDDRPRASLGLGVQLHTKSSMLARMWISGNTDGEIMTNVVLDAFFGRRPRETKP